MATVQRPQLKDQAHVLDAWDDLSDVERAYLVSQINSIDVQRLQRAFEASKEQSSSLPKPDEIEQIEPDRYVVRKALEAPTLEEYHRAGLEAISKGEVGLIVLAGGQASRLGATQPKGTLKLDIGFNKWDSLLWIQAARIARLQKMAAEEFPGTQPRIQWLVMTSQSTHEETKRHLEEIVADVGLRMEDVTVFSQAQIPAFSFPDGKFIMETPSSIATSPDGNGGLYAAIRPHLAEIKARGVKHFHVYCVDNILCRVADPDFIGCAIRKNADCAAKVVEKTNPTEAVGVVCKVAGRVRVVEYSEITPELAERRDQVDAEKLFLRAGSIANHYFTIDFLERVCSADADLPYHAAHKKIRHYDAQLGKSVMPDAPNGVKLEQFVFDVFPHSENFLLWQVDRAEEFSPLKNADSAGRDCPSTCRRDLAEEQARWISPQSRAALVGEDATKRIYVSPMLSYAGEGLEGARFEVARRDECVILVPAASESSWVSATCILV
ncbi:UTP--glucose-1-phosphate uridylyltransferase family protein [Aphelenchoides avenae]|nr:UTP--glucose-1-phosphate uridylyltransferase family protein [Aphelenchus avenae]